MMSQRKLLTGLVGGGLFLTLGILVVYLVQVFDLVPPQRGVFLAVGFVIAAILAFFVARAIWESDL